MILRDLQYQSYCKMERCQFENEKTTELEKYYAAIFCQSC